MTQEDKQLLWVDLCARLPYGVRIQYDNQACKLVAVNDDYTVLLLGEDGHKPNIEDDLFLDIEKAKPYLRPMSSMTEEEAMEIAILHDIKDILSVKVTSDYIEVIVDDSVCSTERRTIWYDEMVSSIKCFDWLNKHHFDYRGLIEKGLALEAPEGMYNLKNK